MSGFGDLGEALVGGGKPGREQAFYTGQQQQATIQHLSAQTQDALANAKLTQQKAKKAQQEQEDNDNLADSLLGAHLVDTPEEANAFAGIIRGGHANFEGAAKGKGELQTQSFKKTLADPNAAPDVRLGASMGITGKPESPLVAAPAENVNAFAPNVATAPTVNQTPLGQARTGQANRSPNAAGAKPPVGFEADPDNPGALRPIKGGPKDPDAPTAMGSREATYFNRVVGAANQSLGELRNIVELPVGASTGYFGVGGSPGTSIMASVKGVLTNKMASQDVQDYNSILPGLERNLASIETAGLVPSGTFSGSFGKLELREGDTEFTKLAKLAQIRQIIDYGLEPAMENPRVAPAQKAFLRKILDGVQESVPFTRSDVIKLRAAQEKNPDMTLSQLIGAKGLGKPKTVVPTGTTPSATPAPAAAKPKTVTQNGHTYTLNEATGEYE